MLPLLVACSMLKCIHILILFMWLVYLGDTTWMVLDKYKGTIKSILADPLTKRLRCGIVYKQVTKMNLAKPFGVLG